MYAPDFLVSLFPDKEKSTYSVNGKYKMKLHVDGEEMDIYVDDYFPCTLNSEDDSKLATVPFQYDKDENKKIIWPMMIEKTLAKEYGSYENLNNAQTDDVLALLTGKEVFQYNLLNKNVKRGISEGLVWRKLTEYNKLCYLMGANSVSKELISSDNIGIVPNHFYIIMDVLECDSYQLIGLKNFMGDNFWNGRWGPFSNTWNRRIKRIVEKYKTRKSQLKDRINSHKLGQSLIKLLENDGKCFYMCFDDFIKYYKTIFFCVSFDDSWQKHVIKDSWTVGRSGGAAINVETVKYNPQYLLIVNKDTDMLLILHQIIPYSKSGKH